MSQCYNLYLQRLFSTLPSTKLSTVTPLYIWETFYTGLCLDIIHSLIHTIYSERHGEKGFFLMVVDRILRIYDKKRYPKLNLIRFVEN